VLILSAVFLLALALRLGLWLELRSDPTYLAPPGDMRGNDEFAVQVVKGTLPPNTYYKAPLYSYFLAAVYWISGIDQAHARIAQIVLTSLSPVLTCLIAWKLFDRRVGVIAGLLASVFWTFLFFSTELLDTALASLFYLLLAWLLLVLDDRKWSKWLICGLVLGLGAIARPNILPFAPILAVMVFTITWRKVCGTGQVPPTQDTPETQREPYGGAISEEAAVKGPVPFGDRKTRDPNPEPRTPNPEPRFRGWRLAVTNVLALTLGTCAAVLPVTLRNRIVGGEWVLIGAYGGLNLYVANNPDSDSKDGPLLIDERLFMVPLRVDPNTPEPWARNCLNYLLGMCLAESKLGRQPKPGEFDAILSGMAKDFIRQNPGWFARHAVRRLCWLFNMYEFQSNRDLQEFSREWGAFRVTRYLHFGILCPLAVVGLVMALGRREHRTAPMFYYVALLASLALPAVLFIINSRFRTPMVHLLVPFAAFGLVEVLGLFRRGVSWTKRSVVLLALVCLAVFSNTNLFGYWEHRKAHLVSKYIDSCARSGRTDLMDRAFDELDEVLTREMEDPRPGNTSIMLQYGQHMTQLFIHYFKRGNYPKALRYGKLMVQRERVLPQAVSAFFDLVIRLEPYDRCRAQLEVIRSRCKADHPDVLASCLLRFGQRYQDVPSLEEAARLYKMLTDRQPANPSFRDGLARCRAILAGLSPAGRAGSGSTTQAVDREVSK
jgi:hypothetical protein